MGLTTVLHTPFVLLVGALLSTAPGVSAAPPEIPDATPNGFSVRRGTNSA